MAGPFDPRTAQPGSLESAFDPTVGAVRLSVTPEPEASPQPTEQPGTPEPQVASNSPTQGFRMLSEQLAEQKGGQVPAQQPAEEPQPEEQSEEAPTEAPAASEPDLGTEALAGAQPLSPVAQTVAKRFLADGYTPTQVAGVLGVLAAGEGSDMNPARQNPISGAFGLYQHLGPRLAGLQQYAGAGMIDPDVQTKFAIGELHGEYAPAGAALRSATNVGDAAHIWRTQFERPGDVNYDPRTSALASRILPSVQAYARGIGTVAPKLPPPPSGGPLALPDLNNSAPLPPTSGSDNRSDTDRNRFLISHSAPLNPVRELVTHTGTGAVETAVSMAGLPGDAAALGNYLTGGQLYKPFDYRNPANPGYNPMGSADMVRATGKVLGYDFENPPPTNVWGDIGTGIGSSIVGSMPLAGAEVGAAKALGWGLTAKRIARIVSDPGKFFGMEGVVNPVGAGVGLGDASAALKDWTGDQKFDWNNYAAATALAAATNLRLPILAMLMPNAMKIMKNAGMAGARAVGLAQPSLAAIQGMDPTTAKAVFGAAITQTLSDAIDQAKIQVANLGNPRPGVLNAAGVNANNYAEAASDLLSTSVEGVYNGAKVNDRLLWSQVDKDVGRDYSTSIGLVQQLKTDFANDVASYNRRLTDFPGDFLDSLLNPSNTPGGPKGLAAIDNLGSGQNTRSAIEAEIRKLEADPSIPGRRAQIGFLGKISGQILQDMQNGTAGANPGAYNAAMAYSRALAQFRNTPEMADVLAKNAAGKDQVNSVLTLDRFLKTGAYGVSAHQTLMQGAALTGNKEPLDLMKDALRQKFVNEVAPNGYVSQQALAQFVGPNKYGPLLAQPEYADLAGEIQQAAKGENDVQQALGLGGNTKPQFSNALSSDDRRAAAVDLWLSNPTERVMANLDSAPNQLGAATGVIKQLSQDPTGQATKGFIRMVSDRALANGVEGLGKWSEDNSGLIRAINTVDPQFGARVQSFATMTGKAGVKAALLDLGARLIGAKVGERLAGEGGGAGFGSSMVMASAGSRLARQWLSQLSDAQALRVSGALLSDQGAYDAFAKGVGLGDYKSLHILHTYLAGMPAGLALRNLAETPQEPPTLMQGEQGRGPSIGSGAAQGGQPVGGQRPLPQAGQMPAEGQMQGQAHLLPQYAKLGNTRPLGPGEYFQNQGGSWSNEITTTVQDPGLNSGKPSVVPTLWVKDGTPTRVSEDEATDLAARSGLKFPSFTTMKQAEAFADKREGNWQHIKPEDSAKVAPLWKQQ